PAGALLCSTVSTTCPIARMGTLFAPPQALITFSTCYTRISLREGAQRPLTDSKAPTFHSLPEFFKLSSRGHHVPQNPHAFVLRIFWMLAPITLLALGAATTVAQHTEVRNNGVGGKIELDYNAAGKVTEMRAIGADGKLQQKVDYEYLPGYYGAQQTDTTYFPDGKVRRVARNTYDESSNFTGEFIQVFDESGKQGNATSRGRSTNGPPATEDRAHAAHDSGPAVHHHSEQGGRAGVARAGSYR